MASAVPPRWDRAKRCRPCYWQEFETWEHHVWSLWNLCQAGEASTDPETREKRVRFWCDWQAFGQAREGGHPAFHDPRWEPWEIQALMRMIASELNSNPSAQQAALNPSSWRRRGAD